MKIVLIALIITLSLLTIATKTLSEKCNPKDKKVLLQIKQAFNNPYILASWNPEDDCCDWYGVECSPRNNRIIELTVQGGELSGQIPAAIGDLPYLEELVLRKLSNLTGSIPVAITKLKSLKMLWLSWTNLSGSVPGFISKLPNLTYLNLGFNDLTGTIPSELANLKNLDAIFLDRNKLTGSIPDSFGKWAGKIPDLYLSHNQLSGKIPPSLGNLNYSLNFGTIELSRNRLEGDASMLFGANKSLWKLDISRNLFQFDLTKLEFPNGLVYFDINHNKIFGSLPASMTGLELQSLNVSYNRLCGKIPTGGRLQKFDYSSYFHNRCLCGSPLSNC